MFKISTDEVRRIAALAHIGLNDEEVARMAVELGQIVEFVEQLKAVDTEGVEPTDQVTGLIDVMRPDEVKPSKVTQDELLANAPEQRDGFIKVRRVL